MPDLIIFQNGFQLLQFLVHEVCLKWKVPRSFPTHHLPRRFNELRFLYLRFGNSWRQPIKSIIFLLMSSKESLEPHHQPAIKFPIQTALIILMVNSDATWSYLAAVWAEAVSSVCWCCAKQWFSSGSVLIFETVDEVGMFIIAVKLLY